jgi:predicted HTH transcriptional regulator
MKETQHIEWKESWRDEYLRWICGFANAEGGVLVIGRNDKGEVVGVKDASRLLQDIPNKVRDILGIMVDVSIITVAVAPSKNSRVRHLTVFCYASRGCTGTAYLCPM